MMLIVILALTGVAVFVLVDARVAIGAIGAIGAIAGGCVGRIKGGGVFEPSNS